MSLLARVDADEISQISFFGLNHDRRALCPGSWVTRTSRITAVARAPLYRTGAK